MKESRKIAIYLRLSLEEELPAGKPPLAQWESNSISSQRRMLLGYIGKDDELKAQEVVEFCDDGFSGTNMDRPGMQELLRQVKKKEIGCILVKDMSRFARNYIVLGDYLNQIFPFMDVRFISVNDHFDSREHTGSTIGLDTAFQTLLYDLYSKDVSVKVRASLQNKCANGEYVFGQVPFGYAKSKTEKNMVIVNEEEAEIVRYIFSLAVKGMSSTQIAKKLIAEHTRTITQMRYPERKMERAYPAWSNAVVRGILNNRFYLGEMVYGKTVRKSVGGKSRIALPEKEWKVITDHHEPLVTPEEFSLASVFLPEKCTKRKREKHPLTGKIYCGGCGYSLCYKPQSRNGRTPNHFWCRKHSLLQIPDCCTYFRADVLEEIVLVELYRELMYRGDLIKQRENLEQFQKEECSRLNKELRNYKTLHQNLLTKKNELYELYAGKQITVEEYQNESDAVALQRQEMLCRIEEIQRRTIKLKEEYHRQKSDMKEIIRCLRMEELAQYTVDVFIKKVTIYSNKRVEIEWNYTF